MTEQWWTPEAVEALHDAGAYCGTCDYEDWGEDYRCPDCVRCLQDFLTALTPHVRAVGCLGEPMSSDPAKVGHETQIAILSARVHQVRAEAFEEAKRIVAATILWDDRDKGTVIAALDRASTTTPEAT